MVMEFTFALEFTFSSQHIITKYAGEGKAGEDAAGTAGGRDAGADLVVAAQCFHLC